MSYNKKLLQLITENLNKPSKPKVPRNQWQHPGEITSIPSKNITMRGVTYPVLGVDANGYAQMMQPGEDYTFTQGPVVEYPMMQTGGPISYEAWKQKYNLRETPDYRLKRAWELGYVPDAKGHLPTIDNQTGMFLKAKGHPSLQLEIDWYNSPEGAEFKSRNIIDSSGKFYKYVPRPKMQTGGWLNKYDEGGDIDIPLLPVNVRQPVYDNIRSQPLRREVLRKVINDQKKEERLREEKYGSIKPAGEKRGAMSKGLAIVANPFTAAKYVVKGQNIPDNFDRGNLNAFDYASQVINPFNAAYDLGNAAGELSKGNILPAAVNVVSGMTSLPMTKVSSPRLYGATTHVLKDVVTNFDPKRQLEELATIYGLEAADKLASVATRIPATNRLYKDLAYHVAKNSEGSATIPADYLLKILNNKKNRGDYKGTKNTMSYMDETGTTHYELFDDDRDLLKQYIYGNQPGFTRSNIKPIGIGKYNKNNDIDVYEMSSNIPSGDLLEMSREEIKHLGGPEALKKLKSQGMLPLIMQREDMNPINPFDDVAGHMMYIVKNKKGRPTAISQDVWKFDKNDYAAKWGNLNPYEHYKAYKQASLMERAGKPFVLIQQNPLSIRNTTAEVYDQLANMDFRRGGIVPTQRGWLDRYDDKG